MLNILERTRVSLKKKMPIAIRTELKKRLKRKLSGEEVQYLIGKYIRKSGKNAASSVKKILFWIPGGMPAMNNVEASMATALKMRGIDASLVICDGALSGCIQREIVDKTPIREWASRCTKCFWKCRSAIEAFTLPAKGITGFLPESRRTELRRLAEDISPTDFFSFRHCGVNIGKNVLSSAMRYFLSGTVENRESIIREYVYAGLVAAEAAARCIDEFKPDKIFMSHAIYVDWGPMLSLAVKKGIPVTAWMGSYLEDHFYLRTIKDAGNLDILNMSDEAWERRKGVILSDKENDKLDKFLENRYVKNISFDMAKKYPPPREKNELQHELNISGKKPAWCVFTHINWDVAFDYSPMLYADVNSWLVDTVNTAVNTPEIDWIIKIHPAESWVTSVRGAHALIKEKFPVLPPHIRIISADSDINPYALYPVIDGGVTVFSTAGLELAMRGKPVILAGTAHYGRKGFTCDPETKEEYRYLLGQAGMLTRLSAETAALAKQYAYSYFIQRQIPMPPTIKSMGDKWWRVDFKKIDELLPGRNRALDMVCEKIVNGGDFILE